MLFPSFIPPDNKRILDDLHLQVKELEEKRAKIQPIINLVDNMVKLGSLYRGPSDAPLSHRIRNLPSASSNANVNFKSNTNSTPNPVPQELKDEIQVSLVHKTLFRKKMFALNEMFQQNASKFAIFYVSENTCSFFRFSFRATLYFCLINALVYVDINQGIHKVKI